MSIKKAHRQRGDTIVEVLIAIAVLAGVLGSTFAIANRSQNTVQANAERDQAVLYANQQAEFIRVASTGTDTARATFLANIISASDTFCMDGVTLVKPATSSVCQKDSLYNIVVTPFKSSALSSWDTYTIDITWDSLSSTGTDSVRLVYGI